MADFVANLDRINTLAESSPGFVWRLQTAAGDATGIRVFGGDILVNMSVWVDVESLHNYTYRTAHTEIMRQRKAWFQRMDEAYSVLWWVPCGHLPTLDEAKQRLEQLNSDGPTARAFTFKKVFSV